MDLSADTLRIAYYGVSAIFIGALGWNGWRKGAGQVMTLVAVACAYTAAYYGASSAAPVFAFLKFPQPILWIIGATAVGGATFLGVSGLRYWFFKPTARQKNPNVQMSFKVLGAIIGVTFGSLLFLFTTGLVRAVGDVAESRIEDIAHERKVAPAMVQDDPGALVRNFAKLNSALGEGASGKFLKRYNAAPLTHALATFTKLGIMVSRPEAVDRFLSYPGVDMLAMHPKLVAVKNDHEVLRLLTEGGIPNYLQLMRHEKVLALSSDTEFRALLEKMEFEKALDFALKPDAQTPPPLPPLPPLEVPVAPEPR